MGLHYWSPSLQPSPNNRHVNHPFLRSFSLGPFLRSVLVSLAFDLNSSSLCCFASSSFFSPLPLSPLVSFLTATDFWREGHRSPLPNAGWGSLLG